MPTLKITGHHFHSNSTR